MPSDLLMRIHSFSVRIGRDCVIAAGAVVADDVPAQSRVTGTKATVRRTW